MVRVLLRGLVLEDSRAQGCTPPSGCPCCWVSWQGPERPKRLSTYPPQPRDMSGVREGGGRCPDAHRPLETLSQTLPLWGLGNC